MRDHLRNHPFCLPFLALDIVKDGLFMLREHHMDSHGLCLAVAPDAPNRLKPGFPAIIHANKDRLMTMLPIHPEAKDGRLADEDALLAGQPEIMEAFFFFKGCCALNRNAVLANRLGEEVLFSV